MEQVIRFAEAPDGVRIAYGVVGDGLPLVKTAHWLNHLEHEWNSPLWRPWLERMARRWKLIRYDERGCGLSDRDIAGFRFEDWISDLEAVVNACGLERFALVGMSQGAAVAVEYAARHPDRVSHLVLYGSYLRGRAHRPALPGREAEADTLLRLIELGWGDVASPYAALFASLFIHEPDATQRRLFAELQRASSTREMAVAILKGFHHIDVTASARGLTVPTLVLHVRRDARVPFEEGRRTASLIPGARLVALEGDNHILQAGEPALDQFIDSMSAFLAESQRTTSPRTLPPGLLTQREKDVLELIAGGTDNAAIAQQLFLSPSTVRNHITRIFAKIDVQTRAEAIVLARRSGFGQG